jgi:tetratricopeptide (TPR) repeat protein
LNMQTDYPLKNYLSWAKVLPEECNPKVNYLLAKHFYSQSLYEDSLKQILLALKKADKWWELYEKLAWVGFKLNDFASVHQKHTKASKKFPQSSEIWTSWGTAYLLEDNLEKASEKFQEALKLNSSSELANFGAGLIELKKINLSHQKIDLKNIQEKFKAQEKLFFPNRHFSLALKLLEDKKTQEAQEKLESIFHHLLEFEPFDQFDQFLLDFLLHRDQADFPSLKNGIEKLEIEETKEEKGQIYNKLGISHLFLVRFLLDEAKNQLSLAVSMNPQFTQVLRNAKLLENTDEKLSILFEKVKL